jgi:hypothetical protein
MSSLEHPSLATKSESLVDPISVARVAVSMLVMAANTYPATFTPGEHHEIAELQFQSGVLQTEVNLGLITDGIGQIQE